MCFVIHGHHQSILHNVVLKTKTVSTSGLKLVEYNETVFFKGAVSINVGKKIL